jgi:hypothetical protein
MNYHVITPLNRFQNYNRMRDMLATQGVKWHVIVDADQPFRIEPTNDDWIDCSVFPNTQQRFYERCNNSINQWLDENIVDEDMYAILNDDDGYEPDFFQKIRAEEGDVLIPSMKRGMRTPPGVIPERAHGTNTLVAAPENLKVGHIGVEQLIVRGKILKHCRLPLTIAGDGEMICYIGATNPVKYVPEAYVYFNYLEPGRWD